MDMTVEGEFADEAVMRYSQIVRFGSNLTDHNDRLVESAQ
jgi:hypothetical protein